MSGAVDAKLEAHRRIGGHVRLPRLYRPPGSEITGKDCAGTGANQICSVSVLLVLMVQRRDGLSVETFRKQFATQSGRSGGASAAANAIISTELWGQHGDFKTIDAQMRCMNTHPTRMLSVSWAAMGLLECPAPDEGIGGSGSNPPGAGEDILLPDVIGVPNGAFVWT